MRETKELKKIKGITLIALVITIIILLILSGITITSLTNAGLLTNTKEAKQKSKDAQEEEHETLESYLAQMNAITFSNVDKTKTNPEAAIPKDATVVEGDANKGIVIKDSNDNEWVWIEVPKSIYKEKTTETDYEGIYNALDTYATEYRKGSDKQIDSKTTDEWYEGCGIDSSKEYTEMYNRMLTSVYTNGGFWISRYEIGDSKATESNKTRVSNEVGIAVSKQNQIPYNYVICSEAQELASKMSNDTSKKSSLLFGIQWDLVCKFLEEKTNLSIYDLKSNSATWGNYKDTSLILNIGKYNIAPGNSKSIWNFYDVNTDNYVENSSTSNDENYKQLLTTGASEQTNKMNIYDFAGNEWEWTLEHVTNSNTYHCIARGGGFDNKATDNPATYRLGNVVKRTNHYAFGFRTTIY